VASVQGNILKVSMLKSLICGVLMNEIMALIKNLENCPAFLPCEDAVRNIIYEPESWPSPDIKSTRALIFGFPA
jgi:hypothetical protein